jgi:hypothetical protein
MKTYPQILAPGVAVIGRYEPSNFSIKKIAEELLYLTDSLDLQTKTYSNPMDDFVADDRCVSDQHAYEVRSPKNNNLMVKKSGEIRNWHRDRGGIDTALVLWSNREQTEVRTSNRTVIKLNPGDVILIHNKSIMHRIPQKISDDRWFFRRFVKTPNWLKTDQLKSSKHD